MILLPLVLGSALALLAVVSAWSFRRYPARRQCPICAHPTAALEGSRLARRLAPWLQVRWCADCGWEGAGRKGPSFDPIRGPVSHDSGFRWNRDEADTGVPGFEWKSDRDEPPTPEPGHPSGFRWADTIPEDSDGTSPGDAVAHPSGFRWSGSPDPRAGRGPGGRDAEHPSGFRWADTRRAHRTGQAGFMWKDQRDSDR